MTEQTQTPEEQFEAQAAAKRTLPKAKKRVARDKTRPTRRKLTDRLKLDAPERPGYKSRWVADREGGQRVKAFQEAGWALRQDEDDQQADRSIAVPSQYGQVVARSMGGGEVGYLMDIPEEFYAEDRREQEEARRAKEQAIVGESKKANRYGDITIGASEVNRV